MPPILSLVLSLYIVALCAASHVHHGRHLEGEAGSITLHKRVEAAMILDEKHKLNARGRRRYAHARNFIDTLFKHNNVSITVKTPEAQKGVGYDADKDPDLFQFQAWPGTTTANCPEPYEAPELRPGHIEGMDRGLLITHREIWDKFVRRRTKGPAAKQRVRVPESHDVLIVFEDDVYPLQDGYQLEMLKEIEKMDTDIHWLGWCYYTKKTESPLCMHAYAVTVKGARHLVDFTETCGPKPLDKQVQEMHWPKNQREDGWNSSWSMTPPDAWDNGGIYKHPRVHPYISNHEHKEGVSVPDILAYGGYGGIFVQVDFDANPNDVDAANGGHQHTASKMEGWVVKGKVSPAVYLVKDGTLHLYPDSKTFTAAGHDFAQVKVLSEWQIRQLPVGDPVPQK